MWAYQGFTVDLLVFSHPEKFLEAAFLERFVSNPGTSAEFFLELYDSSNILQRTCFCKIRQD
jgi:hypothetical protein